MDDKQTQELLRDTEFPRQSMRVVEARPATLVVAFLTVIGLTTVVALGPWFATSFYSAQLIRMAWMESRFSAYVGVVFWLTFRSHTPNFTARIVPIACSVSAIVLEWGVDENTFGLWLLSYRLAIVCLILDLVRRGFRLGLQSACEPPFATRGLNLATILFVTALFALLLMADTHLRKSMNGRWLGGEYFPPGLAIASACSRSFLWVGLMLLFAQGDRRYKVAGGVSLCFWAVARAAIVVYTHWYLKSGFSRQRIPESEQLLLHFVMQVFQFGFVLTTCALLFWTGYRIRIGSKISVPALQADSGFDSIR